MCTEFGGVNIEGGNADSNRELAWGYTTASNEKDLLVRVEQLMMATVEGGHICGFVYTQL